MTDNSISTEIFQKGKWKNISQGKVPVKIHYMGSNRFHKRVPITATRDVLPQNALSGDYEIDFAKLEERGIDFPTPDNVNRFHSHVGAEEDHPVSKVHKFENGKDDKETQAEHRDERELYSRNYYKVKQQLTSLERQKEVKNSELVQKVKKFKTKKKLTAAERAELDELEEKIQQNKEDKKTPEKLNWLDQYNVKRAFDKKIKIQGTPVDAEVFYLKDSKNKIYLFEYNRRAWLYSKHIKAKPFDTRKEAFDHIGKIFENTKLRNNVFYKSLNEVQNPLDINPGEPTNIPGDEKTEQKVMAEYASGDNKVTLEGLNNNYQVSINDYKAVTTENIKEALAKYYSEIAKIISAHSENRDLGLEIFGQKVILTNRNVQRHFADLDKSLEVEFLKDLDYSTLTVDPFNPDFILKMEHQSDVFSLAPLPEEQDGTNEIGLTPGRKDLKNNDYKRDSKSNLEQKPMDKDNEKNMPGLGPTIVTKSSNVGNFEPKLNESETEILPHQNPIKVSSSYQQKLKLPENSVIEKKINNLIIKQLVDETWGVFCK